MEILKGIHGVYFLAGACIAGGIVERLVPWRRTRFDLWRWVRAGLLNFYGVALLALLPFISGYGLAVLAEKTGFGLLNVIGVPFWAALLIAVVVDDALAFCQHALLHAHPALWRLHRTHHTDPMVDVSTSLRFHPFETLFRACIEAPFVFLLGLPPEGMLAAYAVLVIVNVYTHINAPLPLAVEKALSPVLVTTPMHRLHHTADAGNQRMNYGTVFSLWDGLLGTRAGPGAFAEDAVFGVADGEAPPRESFGQLLMDPFRKPAPDSSPKADGRSAA